MAKKGQEWEISDQNNNTALNATNRKVVVLRPICTSTASGLTRCLLSAVTLETDCRRTTTAALLGDTALELDPPDTVDAFSEASDIVDIGTSSSRRSPGTGLSLLPSIGSSIVVIFDRVYGIKGRSDGRSACLRCIIL